MARRSYPLPKVSGLLEPGPVVTKRFCRNAATVAPDRRQETARIRRLLERMQSPRMHMFLIVSLTAALGFLASYSLLHGGLDRMWIRYPLAVAYLGFLIMLWAWLRLRKDEILDGLDLPGRLSDAGSGGDGLHHGLEPPEGGGGHFGGGGQSGSFESPGSGDSFSPLSSSSDSDSGSVVSDVAGALDLEELALVIVAILALIGSIWAAFSILSAAPTLFAELILDGAAATGLYKRLRRIEGEGWLNTAVRKTGWRFAGVAALFSLLGAFMQVVAPGARSIGQFLR